MTTPASDLGATFRLHRAGTPALAVTGELDVTTAPALRAHLDQLLSGGRGPVVVDLGAVSFIDSSGVHVLVDAALEHPGRVRLGERTAAVDRVLELTGVDDLFA